jgi:Ohr subfamily peroxiredoxin
MDALYTAEATAWGPREGRAASSDGNLDVTLNMPKELGGPGGAGTNPEQLFAAGYAACFHGALKLVARGQGVDVGESAITVRVGIGRDETSFGINAEIIGEMPGVDGAKAKELLEAAHQVCPYSKATRGNIDVQLSVHED